MRSRPPVPSLLLPAVALLGLCATVFPQATPTQSPSQTPRTAPQVEQTLASYEGQNVASVELAGRPDLDTRSLEPLLRQHAGQPFAQANVDASIAALKSTGKFNDVQLQVRPEANGVRVLFVLQPAMYFGMYEFPGAINRFAYSRLLQIAQYPPRGEYTPVDVSDAQGELETFFHRNGYFLATVKPSLVINKQYGIVSVIFNTTLGRRAKFGKIDIAGPLPYMAQHLSDKLTSLMARLHGAAIRPGKTYKLNTIEKAAEYLQSSLASDGYLAADVRPAGAEYDPAANRADVKFNVKTGSPVHVSVEGAHLWSWTKHKLLPVYQQVGVNPELIQEGRQNLISYFQSKGYFDATVDVAQQQTPQGETIAYKITKGPRHRVHSVSIAGNQHYSDDDLLKHVTVKKGGWISHGDYSEKLARESVKNLQNFYKANGFSTVSVTPQVKTSPDGNVNVTFLVNEGPQDIVESLSLEGNKTRGVAELAPKGLKLEAGKPYSQKAADDDRNQITAQYLRLGYLTVTFQETAQQAGNDKHKLNVVYHIYEGPQVHTAALITIGRKDAKQKLINRNIAEIKRGYPLTESDLLASESALYTTGVFDWAEVDPRRQITTQTKEDVVTKVHEAKKNQMTYGFGFEVINRGGSVPSGTVALPGLPPVGLSKNFRTSQTTFYGPRGTFEYTRNNLRGKAESVTFSVFAGRLDQRGSITYTDPFFRWSSWSSNANISGEHNAENPIFSSRIAQFGYQLQRPLNHDKTENWFIRYSFTETGLTHLLIPALVPVADQHVRLSTISSTFTRDTRDSTLDAHKGIYESVEADVNPSSLGSNVNFARLLAQTAYYKKIPANIIWANSLRIGLEQAFANSHVPLSEEFFSGGGSTLRGFPLNGAGPQRQIPACGTPGDPSTCSLIQVPVGGNQLFIINSELRIPLPSNSGFLKNLGIATFYDGGNVYRNVGFHNFGADYTNNVGVGLRYATPVGPVRFDIGHNLNGLPGIKSTQFFFTIGQAF